MGEYAYNKLQEQGYPIGQEAYMRFVKNYMPEQKVSDEFWEMVGEVQ